MYKKEERSGLVKTATKPNHMQNIQVNQTCSHLKLGSKYIAITCVPNKNRVDAMLKRRYSTLGATIVRFAILMVAADPRVEARANDDTQVENMTKDLLCLVIGSGSFVSSPIFTIIYQPLFDVDDLML